MDVTFAICAGLAAWMDGWMDSYMAFLNPDIGSRLLKLNISAYAFKKPLEFVQLMMLCPRLEELVIRDSIRNEEEGEWNKSFVVPTEAVGPDFLPHLKTLQVACCLGQFGRIFETAVRPALTNLQINCSHFGVAGASDFKWIDAPRLWPNLQDLKLNYSQHLTSLSIDVISSFKKLQRLEMPDLGDFFWLHGGQDETLIQLLRTELKFKAEILRLDRLAYFTTNFYKTYYNHCLYEL